jgi:acyl-CoA synthetase (AMP-forming)/AMP-acid ligase II
MRDGLTVNAQLEHAAREFATREALIDGARSLTYAELADAAARAAGALARRGIARGDRVAASLPNCAELVIAFLATQRLGAIWVGINRVLAPPEKEFILRDAGAKLLLDDPRRVDAGAPVPAAEVHPFAPAAIAYTSGTTGFPKGAVHSQHNLCVPGYVSHATAELPADTRHGCALPLTILNLLVLGPVLALQQGAACVMLEGTKGPALAEAIRRQRIGYFAGVPTLLYDLLHSPEVAPADLATLHTVLIGGADSPETLVRDFRERFGTRVVIGYGMTEAPTAVTKTDGGAVGEGACGHALPQVEVSIVAEDGAPLPADEVGEICVAPATTGRFAGLYRPFLGYWNQPEASARALAGGRFHSGDLGCLDAAGALSIRGRKSELILRGGANVYPAEVERVLLADPRVGACAVVGRKDERLGERVVALVERKPGAPSVAAEELRALCAERLARYKVPEEIWFVDALPRNAMGKIARRELAPLMESP